MNAKYNKALPQFLALIDSVSHYSQLQLFDLRAACPILTIQECLGNEWKFVQVPRQHAGCTNIHYGPHVDDRLVDELNGRQQDRRTSRDHKRWKRVQDCRESCTAPGILRFSTIKRLPG